jgi:SagB-type dehydrogenase family enzyme
MIARNSPPRGRATLAWSAIVGLLVGAAVVGCGSSATLSPAASSTSTLLATPTATATPTPVPTPTPEPTPTQGPTPKPGSLVALPAPRKDSSVSLESVLARRRSVREFTKQALTLEEISQLLWAAQGVTSSWGGRTAPSAGALYPLEVYVVTKERVLHYLPAHHQAEVHLTGDRRPALEAAGMSQASIGDAPAVFVITGVVARTQAKYGSRASRYVYLEAGHAAQNLLLEAVALNLGGVPIGAFTDASVSSVLSLPSDRRPIYLIPIGHPS